MTDDATAPQCPALTRHPFGSLPPRAQPMLRLAQPAGASLVLARPTQISVYSLPLAQYKCLKARSALRYLSNTLAGLGLALGFILILASAAGAWAFYLQRTGNVHVGAPGAVYRSNTLGQDQLAQLIGENGIKTVLNLRGGDFSQDWYRLERQTNAALGVAQIDIELSDAEIPSPAVMARLIVALRTAPKPLLIHCRAGADRTGLAAALYQYLVAGQPAEIAADQLSFRYGHFPYYPSRTFAMDDAFWQVVRARPPRPQPAVTGNAGLPRHTALN